MIENSQKSKNNLTAIAVGFFLIILVTSVFFLKSSLLNKKNRSDLSKEIIQQEEDDLKKYTSISATDLLAKISSSENFEILDIRDADSFSSSHIVDSKNISLDTLGQDISFFDKEKQYYIVDDLGLTPTQKQLTDILSEQGFEKVSYLEGGIYNWKAELNPMVEFGNPNSFSDQSKVNYITSDDLKRLITDEGNTLHIVDLRNPQNYAEGHLKNAVNISLENLEARRKEIPNYKRIILYDDTGIIAFQGAVRLFDMGVLNVFALSDGLNTWKEKGFEVVK